MATLFCKHVAPTDAQQRSSVTRSSRCSQRQFPVSFSQMTVTKILRTKPCAAQLLFSSQREIPICATPNSTVPHLLYLYPNNPEFPCSFDYHWFFHLFSVRACTPKRLLLQFHSLPDDLLRQLPHYPSDPVLLALVIKNLSAPSIAAYLNLPVPFPSEPKQSSSSSSLLLQAPLCVLRCFHAMHLEFPNSVSQD